MINCLVIDDEPLAVEQVVRYVDKTPFLTLKGSFLSALKAMNSKLLSDTQLVFLDINMPDISGMEFSKLLPKQTKVIFTTAYPQFALEGYKVNALDYLLKPISYEEFLAASIKAKEHFEMVQSANDRHSTNYMFVKSEYQSIKIDFSKVLYIESMKDYVKIFLKGKPKPVLTLMTIKSMERSLPASQFLRVHRSFIINMNCVETVDKTTLVIDNSVIPIGESYRASTKTKLGY